MRPNEVRQRVEKVSVREGVTEVNWTIACGSEIKQDAGLWRLAQISPANIETEWFSPVQYLDGRTSAYFADFCSRPHRQLVQFTGVTPYPWSTTSQSDLFRIAMCHQA